MKCRHCGKALQHQFLDLGFAPPSNAYLNPEDLHAPELYFPLKLHVCDRCWLVQTEDYSRSDELFTADYANDFVSAFKEKCGWAEAMNNVVAQLA